MYDFLARLGPYIAAAPVLPILAYWGCFIFPTMAIFLNLIIFVLLVWLGYKLFFMAVEAVKLAVKQAAYLEHNFGTDIARAAWYTVGLDKEGQDDA